MENLIKAVEKAFQKKFPKFQWETSTIKNQIYDSHTYEGLELSFKRNENSSFVRFVRLKTIKEPKMRSQGKRYELAVYFYDTFEDGEYNNNPSFCSYLSELPTEKELLKIVKNTQKSVKPYFM